VSLLHLIWRNLMRKWLRSTFTVLSVLVAFVLFNYLAAIHLAFTLGLDLTGEDRLVVIHKTSLILPLPKSYHNRLLATPGVTEATYATWFGGKYQDYPEGRFPIFPVDPEGWMSLYTEFRLPEAQMKAWQANRIGAVVGRKTADEMGFEVGQRVPIQGTIFHQADGNDTWEFVIEGIYEGREPGVDETQFLVHYEYFNEARDPQTKDLVGWYSVRIDDPDNAAAIAKQIDMGFANSFYETETTTEKAFVKGFADQIGNIGKIMTGVMIAVFFTILLVAGNTMAQSVRERTSELAVLKTLGFDDRTVLGIVLAEALMISLLGGGVGLLLGWGSITLMGDPTGGLLAVFYVPAKFLLLGAALVVALGLAAGILPAVQAMRLRIVDALRRA
jgi:putative ABC transport system permease protein